ncbi:barren [Pseudovirgaria hyperparasitica]|uniref:Condensin complex subunit 2 n=1 Tax=Pseudovirgaria hyperparasitica TaxID=470096 RepID=A0A6A6WB43_9PEZI|nr:barren [Pseudovirgaria hyperparasitica]KAF2759254.1 barren [Pseudovirgaria hyperparasitica]
MPRSRQSRQSLYGGSGTPMKIPLNDDRQEKANRLKSRQAQHADQINQIKAAATPVRNKRLSLVAGGSPHTPIGRDDDDRTPKGMTPLRKVPILADFEAWMKMATDNKINAANSWSFALIDYFHDMRLLKEGDGVNFQKASCTLDGCVKIYTNRVDSVATETGKLLSGLADSRDKGRKGDDDGEDGEDGEEEEGEDGTKRKKKKTQRSSEATLVSSFAQLQLKKMELEFSVDPLFKKVSADFDEGGAKGLLLNHLAIDKKGRIVFDSSDDAQDATAQDTRSSIVESNEETVEETSAQNENLDTDISALGAKYFPDLSELDDKDVCPSLKNVDFGDPNGSLDLPFLKAPEDWRQDAHKEDEGEGDRSGVFIDGENALGFDDDDDDGGLGGFDLPADVGFGEGGEAWAKEAALEKQMRVHAVTMMHGEDDGDAQMGGTEENAQYAISMARAEDHENVLNYFDQALQKNWAGPELWKIKRIKDMTKATTTPAPKRKEKEPFEIDFLAPMSQSLADALYTKPSTNAAISLPKAQWKSKTRNLLPDDKHFNSRQLLQLFLKPKARMGPRRTGYGGHTSGPSNDVVPEGEVGEEYWARNEDAIPSTEGENPQGDYDANFFQDDGLGLPGAGIDEDDDEFVDAPETFAPPIEGGDVAIPLDAAFPGSQSGAFGENLIAQSRRSRPEYVQYARVAKKVDVRRLKENLWRGIGYEEVTVPPTPSKQIAKPIHKSEDGSFKFTELINNLQDVYPKQQMDDISTSFCFICVLHLANEKGLEITNETNFTDLTIRRDPSMELTVGDD